MHVHPTHTLLHISPDLQCESVPLISNFLMQAFAQWSAHDLAQPYSVHSCGWTTLGHGLRRCIVGLLVPQYTYRILSRVSAHGRL